MIITFPSQNSPKSLNMFYNNENIKKIIIITSNNQRLTNAGEDFSFYAHLRTKRFGGL